MSEKEIKAFMLEKVAGHLAEAYRSFLSLESLFTEQEREKLRFWKSLRQLYFMKERMRDKYEKYKKGLKGL